VPANNVKVEEAKRKEPEERGGLYPQAKVFGSVFRLFAYEKGGGNLLTCQTGPGCSFKI
jgi:hypothetical protein